MVMQAAQGFGRFVDSIQRNASRFNDPTDQSPEFYDSLEENQRQAEIKPSVKDRKELEKLIPIAVEFRNRGKNQEEGQKAIQRLAEIPGGLQTLDKVSAEAMAQNLRFMQGETPENLGQAIRRDIGRAGKEIITPKVSAEQIERGFERIPGSNIEQSIPQPIQRASQFVSDVMPFIPGPQQLTSRLTPSTREEAAQFLSEQTTPLGIGLTVGTAGAGGTVPMAALTKGIAAAPRGISTGLRAVRGLVRPFAETSEGFRGFLQRLLTEQAAEAGGILGSQAAGRETEGLPAPIRTAAQIGGGLVGGFGGLATIPSLLKAPTRVTVPPRTIKFIRNTESPPNLGTRFGQDVEPAGKYITEATDADIARIEKQEGGPRFESGEVTFENPLVIPFGEGYESANNWKRVLSERYQATGEELSQKIVDDGYDGIITTYNNVPGIPNGTTSEIVDLTSFKKTPTTKDTQSTPVNTQLSFFDSTARNENIEEVFPSSELANPDTTIKQVQQTANQPDVSTPPKNILGEDEQYRKPLDKTPDVDLDDLQDFDQKLDINFSDNAARKLGTRFKSVAGLFNPALRAINEGKKYAINYASQIDEIKNKLNAVFIPVDALGSPLRIFGSNGYDQQYRFTDGAFQGKTVNEIVENPSAFDLNETQIEYIQKLNTIDKAATKKAIALGKDITLLDESQQMYATRKIIAQIDPDTGKPVDVRNLSDVDEKAAQIDTDIDVDELLKGENIKLKTLPIIPTGVEAAKRRQLKNTKDALDNGYVVLPYDQAVKAKVEQVYKLEAAKNLEDAVNKYVKQKDPSVEFKNKGKISSAEGQSQMFRDETLKSAKNSETFLEELKSGLTDYQRTASSVWRKNKFLKGLGNINVLGRSLELAFDASLFGIQLSSVLARDLIANTLRGQRPTIAPATVKNFAKTFAKGLTDPQKATDFGARYLADNVDVIREMDKVELYTTRNIAEFLEGAAAVRNATTFKDGKFSFIGKLTGAYGRGAAPFQEAWTATMNTAKIEMYKNMRHYFTDANGNIIDLARKAEVEDHINNVTGTVSSSRLGVSPLQRNIENILLLAPRYTRATVGLLIDAAQGGLPLFRQRGIRGPGGQRIPLVTTGTSGSLRGKLAQEAIASNLAIFALLGTAYITAQTLIEDGDKPNRKEIWEKKIKDFINPTTGKFFMIQAGENLLGAGGKVISLSKITSKILNKTVKAVADAGGIGEDNDIGIDDPEVISSIRNDIFRFIRGNSSHLVGNTWDFISGEDFMGRRVLGLMNRDTDDTFGQIMKNSALNYGTTFVPIWVQSLGENGLGEIISKDSFLKAGAEFLGERAYEETKNVRRDRIAQASPYNVTSWNDLDAQQKDALTKRLSEDDRQFLIEKEEEDIARGDKFARYRDEKEKLEDDLQAYSEDYLQIFKENIRDANYNTGEIYNELRTFARRVSDQEIRTYAQIESLRDKYEIESFSGQEVENEFDKILNRYYGLYDKYSRTKTVDGVTTVIPGTVDYDQYNLAKESLKATISPGNRAKLEIYLNRKEINQQAQAILQLREPISTNPLRFRNRNEIRAEVFRILNIR